MKNNYIIHITSPKIVDSILTISRLLKQKQPEICLISTFISETDQQRSGEALLLIQMSHKNAAEVKDILESSGITSSCLYQHFEW